MRQEFYRYVAVFVVSASLAFWASLPVQEKDPERKALLSVTAAQVGGVDFMGPELSAKARLEGSKWWIETDKAGTKDRFLASNKMTESLAQLNPLEAVRLIGAVKDDQLEEFGLKTPLKSLTIIDPKGQEMLKLLIGKQAYGSRNVFAKESRENRVLLLSGDFIGDFERPDLKLFERTITSVVFEELQNAVITKGSKSRRLGHTKRDDKGGLIWTDDGKGGGAVASAKSWFERLDRVRVVSFATKEEVPSLDKEPILFQVELEAIAPSKDVLQFVKVSSLKLSGQPSADEYFVKSSFLGAWAKVGSTRVEPIEKDLPTLLDH